MALALSIVPLLRPQLPLPCPAAGPPIAFWGLQYHCGCHSRLQTPHLLYLVSQASVSPVSPPTTGPTYIHLSLLASPWPFCCLRTEIGISFQGVHIPGSYKSLLACQVDILRRITTHSLAQEKGTFQTHTSNTCCTVISTPPGIIHLRTLGFYLWCLAVTYPYVSRTVLLSAMREYSAFTEKQAKSWWSWGSKQAELIFLLNPL